MVGLIRVPGDWMGEFPCPIRSLPEARIPSIRGGIRLCEKNMNAAAVG